MGWREEEVSSFILSRPPPLYSSNPHESSIANKFSRQPKGYRIFYTMKEIGGMNHTLYTDAHTQLLIVFSFTYCYGFHNLNFFSQFMLNSNL